MKKKTDKYVSHDMQNEILKVMSLQVSHKIIDCLHSTDYFTIMIDETTDCSNSEQVVICCRWVDSSLEAHEEFMGLYQVGSTKASALVHVIKDFLLRSNLSISKLRGQCYDGASSMCGSKNGVATQIAKEEPRALYTHCYGHSLNLACSDTIKQSKIIRNSLDSVLEITKLVKKSPRRESILLDLKQKLSVESPGIRVLCPTRWTVCADTL